MIALSASTLALLVFVIAGCTSVAVIGISVRRALPQIRRLVDERRTLADDQAFLVTLIETPRHQPGQAPVAMLVGNAVPAGRGSISRVRTPVRRASLRVAA